MSSKNNELVVKNVVIPKDVMRYYIRNKKSQEPRGVLVSFKMGDKVLVGYAMCHQEVDNFDRETGTKIAVARALKWENYEYNVLKDEFGIESFPVIYPEEISTKSSALDPLNQKMVYIPHSVNKLLASFVYRSSRWFKDASSMSYWAELILEEDQKKRQLERSLELEETINT